MTTELLDLKTANPVNIQTTENALTEIRKTMRYYKAKQTIRRSGWYFTEPRYQ